jgi:AcrR family transcriptional regulator
MNRVSIQKRKYRLHARAESQQVTRNRIVAATMGLHGKVGPAKTTIADIARVAGVQRLTVYNHFPTLSDLLGACQGHFLTLHPPPDLLPRVPRAKARHRLETALTELYGWYRTNEAMEGHIHTDRNLVPELDELLHRNLDPALDGAAAAYAKLLGAQSRPLIRVALEFATWRLLARQGLKDREIARLFARASSRPV